MLELMGGNDGFEDDRPAYADAPLSVAAIPDGTPDRSVLQLDAKQGMNPRHDG